MTVKISKARIKTARQVVNRLQGSGITLSSLCDLGTPPKDFMGVYNCIDDLFGVSGKAGLDNDGYDRNLIAVLEKNPKGGRLTPEDMNDIYARMISEGVDFYCDALIYLGHAGEGDNFEIETLAILKGASAGLLTATLYHDPFQENRQKRVDIFSARLPSLISVMEYFDDPVQTLSFFHDQLNDLMDNSYPEDWQNGINDLRHWLTNIPDWPEHNRPLENTPPYPTPGPT